MREDLHMSVIVKVILPAIFEIRLDYDELPSVCQNSSYFGKRFERLIARQVLEDVTGEDNVKRTSFEPDHVCTGVNVGNDTVTSVAEDFARDVQCVLFPTLDLVDKMAIACTDLQN